MNDMVDFLSSYQRESQHLLPREHQKPGEVQESAGPAAAVAARLNLSALSAIKSMVLFCSISPALCAMGLMEIIKRPGFTGYLTGSLTNGTQAPKGVPRA